MTYLLDTHTFIWATLDTKKLPERVRHCIAGKDNEIYVSTISFWEIALKTSINKMSFDGIDIKNFPKYAVGMGFNIMSMQAQESITFSDLVIKSNHKDPFDRMIIWQAITNDMTLISKDRLFKQYKDNGLKLIW
jgi:PIN domain nuclease of toxin-antitoxin system